MQHPDFLKSCLGIFSLAALPTALLLVVGCAGKPRIKPINHINEPVFYSKPYAAIGIGGGVLMRQGGPFNLADQKGYRQEIYIEPSVNLFTPVTSWAGYNLLPVHWNFLLTGEQYQDSEATILKQGKLHLALSGGLVGGSYASGGEWEFVFGSRALAKYRFSNRLFSEAGYHGHITHNLNVAVDGWSIGFGYQVDPRFSVLANYAGDRYTFGRNRSTTVNGLPLLNGDIHSILGLVAPWYLTPKHALAPEAAYGFRNAGGDAGHYYKAGLQYRFVFD